MPDPDTKYVRLSALAVIAGLLLSSCAIGPTTDLERLYAMQAGNPDQPPVVVIHGALGSRLVNATDDVEIWPGKLRKLLFSDYRGLRLEIDSETLKPRPSEVVTAGIAEGAVGVDFYGRILRTLEVAGGYAPAVPGEPAQDGEKRYYVSSYDWRQDNVDTARELDGFLAQIRQDYDNPELEVDIVAHSMGGMITRYYRTLRYARRPR